MEFALVEGMRHQPEPGLKGACQFCGQAMVAKCGEQILWHWAHKGRKQCDPWWENEGPWHRAWKALFPEDCHEQVRFDSKGEKHIADVMLPSGLVIELQHSQMPLEEMRSREVFHDRMVWIVDAEPFKKNIAIFDPLPDPSLPEVADFRFYAAHPAWRNQRYRQFEGYDDLLMYRQSSVLPGDTLVILVKAKEMGLVFPEGYVGHHLVHWLQPREVWLHTSRPTFLDLGDEVIGKLMFYPPGRKVLCIQLMAKSALIAELLAWSGQSVTCTDTLPV